MIDQENGLPVGWVICRIGELISLKNGYAYKSSDYSGEGVPLVRISDIHNNQVNLGKAVKIPESKVNYRYTIETGDLLIAMSGATTGKTGVYQGTKLCLQNQRVGNFKIFNEQILLKKYRNHYIASLYKTIEEKAYGGAQPNISAKDIEAFLITLPPLPEQHRIVAEIEKQFSRLDEAVAGLKRIQANLKRYRASVLKSAVEGKLTAEWRKQHPDTEPAEQLLQRILKERHAHWEQAELEKMQAAGKPPKDELWRQKYKEPIAPDVSDLPALPKGWVWSNLEQLKKFSFYGPRFSSDDYVKEGYLVLRTSDINDSGKVNTSTTPKLKLSKEQFDKYKVEKGDLLITRTGSLGTLAVYNDDVESIPGAYLIQYRLLSGINVSWFLFYFLKSPLGLKQLIKGGAGVGRPNLNAPTIESIPIPFSSIEEQVRIVAEIESRLSIADEVEQQINTNLKRAERLRQSILKKAFSGRLVPQDSNDGPADMLLEKIKQAQRA